MAELPEIAQLARQMDDTLKGKTIKEVTLLQEKCLNVSPEEFQRRITGAKINNVGYRGKWFVTELDNGEYILLSVGMGADLLYFESEDSLPAKYQVKVLFEDGTGFTSRFWWFGHFFVVSGAELSTEPNTKDIALDPFNEGFSYDYFASLLKGKKKQIKAFLMDQKNVGGIGNFYMHDILFKSGLHPQKKISDMAENDIKALYKGIYDVLNLSVSKGTASYEMDFFGKKGGYGMEDFYVGYKEDKPCPRCGEGIKQIKTGSTSAFICPACQKL